MKLSKDLKWDFYRVVEGMYSTLPPERIRSKCGVGYAQKTFPELKEDLEKLGVDTANYPRFHCKSEMQVRQVVRVLNFRWTEFLKREIEKNEI